MGHAKIPENGWNSLHSDNLAARVVIEVFGPIHCERVHLPRVRANIPPDRFSKLNAAAHAELDAKFEQHKEILGDTEKVMYAAMDVEREVVDTVVWTVPTSIAGIRALLDFRSEAGDLDDDQTDSLLCSIAEALRDLHPSVAVTA
jgi:hypothetical protein